MESKTHLYLDIFISNDLCHYFSLPYEQSFDLKINVYVTVNVIKLVIMHISRLLCTFLGQLRNLMKNESFIKFSGYFASEFEYQVDYLS